MPVTNAVCQNAVFSALHDPDAVYGSKHLQIGTGPTFDHAYLKSLVQASPSYQAITLSQSRWTTGQRIEGLDKVASSVAVQLASCCSMSDVTLQSLPRCINVASLHRLRYNWLQGPNAPIPTSLTRQIRALSQLVNDFGPPCAVRALKSTLHLHRLACNVYHNLLRHPATLNARFRLMPIACVKNVVRRCVSMLIEASHRSVFLMEDATLLLKALAIVLVAVTASRMHVIARLMLHDTLLITSGEVLLNIAEKNIGRSLDRPMFLTLPSVLADLVKFALQRLTPIIQPGDRLFPFCAEKHVGYHLQRVLLVTTGFQYNVHNFRRVGSYLLRSNSDEQNCRLLVSLLGASMLMDHSSATALRSYRISNAAVESQQALQAWTTHLQSKQGGTRITSLDLPHDVPQTSLSTKRVAALLESNPVAIVHDASLNESTARRAHFMLQQASSQYRGKPLSSWQAALRARKTRAKAERLKLKARVVARVTQHVCQHVHTLWHSGISAVERIRNGSCEAFLEDMRKVMAAVCIGLMLPAARLLEAVKQSGAGTIHVPEGLSGYTRLWGQDLPIPCPHLQRMVHTVYVYAPQNAVLYDALYAELKLPRVPLTHLQGAVAALLPGHVHGIASIQGRSTTAIRQQLLALPTSTTDRHTTQSTACTSLLRHLTNSEQQQQ